MTYEEISSITGLAAGKPEGIEPRAIALTPILSARYRDEDLARIRAAAPGARLVNVSLEGLSDSPLDDVDVVEYVTFMAVMAEADVQLFI